jgi:predicted nuclease of predicted toxin-antitoxin system
MKFLIDAQLPPRLVDWLAARGRQARHVMGLPGGLRMPDTEVWQRAATEGLIIVSKDKDFLDLASVRGTPPIIFFIGVGNASTARLLDLLDAAWPTVSAELASPDASVVTLERERIVVLRRA